MILKPFDFGILIPAFGIIIGSFVFVYSDSGSRSIVNVKGEGGVWLFSPDAAETLRVAGPLGDTVVEIRNSEVRVLSSPCVNQTCIAAGAIHARGQWIACLPNRVLVSIDGEADGGGRRSRGAGSSGADDVDAAAW
ncbi:MAG: NusG domain II-containing protein [Treponema sp.]|jgi:hypothetical protein|nr:NusG domain II-containing protein [Treponema sp.]